MNRLARVLRVFVRPEPRRSVGEPERILLFKPGAIGDVLWTTPFVRNLRSRYPRAEVAYCVGRSSRGVLENNPNVDRIIEVDEARLLGKDVLYAARVSRMLRRERFDAAFAFEKHYLSNLLVWSTGIPVRVGFDRSGEGFPLNIAVPYGDEKHEIEYYLDLLLAAGGTPGSRGNGIYETAFGKDWYRTEVFPTAGDRGKVDELFGRFRIPGNAVGLCPGGGVNPGQRTPFRRWPLDRYVELSRQLARRGRVVVLFGGPSDAELGRRFDDACRNLIGRLSVKETIVAMGRCSHVVCNDSGPMNMAAAAVPRPVIVSLFGPTHPRRKAPLGEKSIPLWKDADIYDPGYDLYGRIPGATGFMERISVADVLGTIAEGSGGTG